MNDELGTMNDEPFGVWKLLFFSLVTGYCLYYAPFGVNETDGGFLSGLAWQVLHGKLLYQDIVYVRPPLPVWLRALELKFLPEHFAVLGERWTFYGKVALYSWLGAALVTQGERRWQLAVFGFVLSAHSYPPMAWHTVDGIMFAVLAAFCLCRAAKIAWFFAGISLFGALLCKQSFYPLLPIFALFLFLDKENRWKKMAWFFGSFALSAAMFVHYLYQQNILAGFLQMTSSAASGGQAFQHGILDYFRITPELALPSLLLLAPVAWWFWKGKKPQLAWISWLLWLFALVVSYAAITLLRQDHTAPFAQSRAMFGVAAIYFIVPILRHKTIRPINPALLLLGICWCASVSWGYNLPMLFATPWVWAGMEVTRALEIGAKPIRFLKLYSPAMLLALLLAFRIGHEFVYRDGRRSEMTESMGEIFPRLSGIYSDQASADLYRNLKQLSEFYGPNFKTLPAFPQANFLSNTTPPLPLDWVVNRETNNDNQLIFKTLQESRPVLFIQKSFREKIETDPELAVTRQLLNEGTIVAETPYFWVVLDGGR